MKLPLDYAPDEPLLAGRVVLVTGAGDGIGKAVATLLASHGASIVLVGRNVKKLEASYDDIESAGGENHGIFPMDLLSATPDSVAALRDSVSSEYGRLDGLLHNAGVLGTITPLDHYEPETWLEVMQVNVNACYLLSAMLMPLLRTSDDARVVFTSSGVGRKGRAYWGAYSVSKFAVEGLMQVLAEETESEGRVRVMSVNPGGTRTAMRAAAFPAEDPLTLKTPRDIAPAYLYVFGPEGRALHGMALDCQ